MCSPRRGYAGILKQDCGLYPGNGVDPRGIPCNICCPKPKNCSGGPYGCPYVKYYPCGFGGNSYSCRTTREPWDIKALNHVWNWKDCCCRDKSNCNSCYFDFNNISNIIANSTKAKEVSEENGEKIEEDGENVSGNSMEERNEQLDGSNPREANTSAEGNCTNLEELLQNWGNFVSNNNCGHTWNNCDQQQASSSKWDQEQNDCNEEELIPTREEVSSCMDTIQTYILNGGISGSENVMNSYKSLIMLRMGVLGTLDSISSPGKGIPIKNEPNTNNSRNERQESIRSDNSDSSL